MSLHSQSNQIAIYAFKKGYRILPNGHVVSPRNIERKTVPQSNGYLAFSIRYKGKSISVLVHKLCAFQKYGYIAFSCECIRHLDGNRTNNMLENIEIGSYSDNQLDKSPEERKREATIASHSHIMKWNEEKVAMIKNYHKTSHSYRKTMTRFGISSKGTLHFILKNR